MSNTRKALRAATIAASVAATGALAAPANASATTFRQHDSVDPTGMVFACSPTNLTVTGGMVRESFEGVQDSNGIFHITGTIVPQNVTLTDGTNTYYLSGASWFGDKSISPSGGTSIQFTNTDHFVIRNASGGVYAKVSVIEHLSPNGSYFLKDTGTCETPNG